MQYRFCNQNTADLPLNNSRSQPERSTCQEFAHTGIIPFQAFVCSECSQANKNLEPTDRARQKFPSHNHVTLGQSETCTQIRTDILEMLNCAAGQGSSSPRNMQTKDTNNSVQLALLFVLKKVCKVTCWPLRVRTH